MPINAPQPSEHTPRPDRERPPVYTVWEEFLGWTLERTVDIPKAQRFSFGQRIDAHTLDVLELIVEALFVREKTVLLDAINRKLEVLRVLWRLVQKRGWISLRQLHFVQEKIDEAGRMVGGWRKQQSAGGGGRR
ncbi:MAG: diversity-generating retroelement protein Avd [Opitutales bacterium]|nr:diversity-generating retroelement protein Avd [Opitutales bacterium]